jgi:hypothetical protein
MKVRQKTLFFVVQIVSLANMVSMNALTLVGAKKSESLH